MKYLKIFTDYADDIEELGDAECGRLFRAMLKYAASGAEPEFRGNERFYWNAAKRNIDSARETYERKVQSIANAREAICNQTDNNLKTVCNQTDNRLITVQDKDKDKDKDKGNDKNKHIYVNRFDDFWAVYPRKVAKQDAKKAWDKLKPSEELTEEIIHGVLRLSTSDQWTREGGMFIPHPATFLNGQRWNDELPQRRNGSIFLEVANEMGANQVDGTGIF